MAWLDRWQGSGTQFVSDRYRGWREECWHDHTSAAKTRSSQQKHWPNEIREIHPRSKFLRNSPVRERTLRECDSTRLGPVRDRNPPMTAQMDARSQERNAAYALFAADSCRLWAVSAIGGFGRDPPKTRNRTPTPPSQGEFEGHEAVSGGKCRIIDWFGCSWLAVGGLRWPWCS
jgi:hypothetical protein